MLCWGGVGVWFVVWNCGEFVRGCVVDFGLVYWGFGDGFVYWFWCGCCNVGVVLFWGDVIWIDCWLCGGLGGWYYGGFWLWLVGVVFFEGSCVVFGVGLWLKWFDVGLLLCWCLCLLFGGVGWIFDMGWRVVWVVWGVGVVVVFGMWLSYFVCWGWGVGVWVLGIE